MLKMVMMMTMETILFVRLIVITIIVTIVTSDDAGCFYYHDCSYLYVYEWLEL